MQSTGIVPSSPAIACVVCSSRWMRGISGPAPTICGRRERAARNHAAGREIVERRAHDVDVELVLLAEAAHARASERLGLDQPQQGEVAQGLAYGSLARAELLRDAGLDERSARPQLAPDDPFDQQLL